MKSVTKIDATMRHGRALYVAGWAVFLFSVGIVLSGRSPEPHAVWPSLIVFGILVVVSFVYCVGCFVSDKWRSQTVRRYFSPYLLGAVGWLMFFLIIWLVDRYAG